MDWIEVTARTVDDAKELALDRLGVVEDELEFEVVDEARKGLFGIARGDARIRARVKPISREKPADRKRRGRRPNERSPRGGRSRAGAATADTGDDAAADENRSGASQSPDRAPGQGGARRRRGGRG